MMGESFQADTDLPSGGYASAGRSPSLNQRASFINRPNDTSLHENDTHGDCSNSLRTFKSLTIASPCTDDEENTVTSEQPGCSKQTTVSNNTDASCHSLQPYKGFDISSFEILSTVGTGTFGRVMLVKEKSTKDFFALKIMKKSKIVALKQVQHVKNEKEILLSIKHPFIIQLYSTGKDSIHLYMLLEYVCGGELFSYLRNAGRFCNDTACFFASEITSVFEYLHNAKIIYRDLKPENILLDRDGHTKITDFGFAKCIHDRTFTLCGTPEYLSPEVIHNKGHGKSVDWWALGVLIFEMLAGFPPFWDENPMNIYRKILDGRINFPKYITSNAKDLISKLLTADRTRRLGNMKDGAQDVKKHPWFQTIDWELVAERKLRPPIVPRVSHSGDTTNFENYPEDNWQHDDISSEEKFNNSLLFRDF